MNHYFWHFVDHMLEINMDEIVEKSLMHCHLENVHSIVLREKPEKTIRIFIAEPGNLLHKNTPSGMFRGQSVAFHSHHCDLTILPLTEYVTNMIAIKDDSFSNIGVNKYRYKSKIKTGKIDFEKDGLDNFFVSRLDMRKFEAQIMRAKDIHTIYVPKNTFAAWAVFEGKEDLNYDNSCWSTSDLDTMNFNNLYKPMTKEKIIELLDKAKA